MRAFDWRSHTANTLQGFFNLELPSGMVIHDLTLHEQGNRRWVGLPGKPQLDEDGQHRKDPATGKKLYAPVIEIRSRARRGSFTREALAAVDRMLRIGEPR
jgi:hypothetical protein